ncbi:CusA/CzcA family heavy metal efflux RND transporter [soil metagenome]
MTRMLGILIAAAIQFRYFVLVSTGLLILAGIFAFRFLPIDAYPELADPRVRVITLFPGKGAEEVERLVTIPLEKELNGIPKQISLRSNSLYGLSVITATFSDGTQSALARQQVLERIQQADLPTDASAALEPDVGSIAEIFRYCLRSHYCSPMGLRSIQQWELEKLFRQIPGVTDVVTVGGPTKSYLVNVDQYRLMAHGVSLKQVFDSIAAANATSGGGFLEKNGNALIVRELGVFKSVDDIKQTVISADSNGTATRVGDVADVTVGSWMRRGQVGKEKDDDVVEGIVLLRRGENPSRVLQALYERLPKIVSRLPKGVSLVPFYDRSRLINLTLETVSQNVVVGVILVLVLLVLFLLDLRLALITACVIPLSVLFAFVCLDAFGVPANLLSLGAIDFGILVDSAVVMTENILRRFSQAAKDLTAFESLTLLRESATEVASPIVFGVLIIISTFLPILAFTGVEGKLFRPLAITMCSALVGACFVALTVIPVLCSFFCTKKGLRERSNLLISLLRKLYKPALRWSLRHTQLVISLAVLAVSGSVVLFCSLGSEFLPHLDEGNIWLRATIKPGSVTLAESVKKARQIRLCLLKYPEVTQVLSQEGGSDDGTESCRFGDTEYFIDLKPARQWRAQFRQSKDLLVSSMRRDVEKIPGVSYYFTQYIQTMLDAALSGVEGSLVGKVIGNDLPTLERLNQQVGQIMRRTPGVVDVIVDPLLGQPQLIVDFDREAAARHGLNVQDLRDLVETAIGGKVATNVIDGERSYGVVVRLAAPYRSTEQVIQEQLIDTPSGAKIPLSQIATIKEVNGAIQIWREAGSRLATIRANVRGRDLASTVAELQRVTAADVHMPAGYAVDWSGEFERQRDATKQLLIVVPITLLVIVVILWLACGSLRSALVIFAVIPLSAIGAILALYITGTYFSISAGVGFIALFGIAVMNGVLLVSFIQILIEKGLDHQQAVYQGALTRMRPVLMTASIAMIGLLPAACSNEIGAQTQRPFAIVIIGGLLSSTVLTLLVLPALYVRFGPRLKRTKNTISDQQIPQVKELSHR